jgi:hypothetical protein
VTEGVVDAHEPENHNRYGYRFAVDGRDYHGWDSPVNTTPLVGANVRVYYDSADPATNALTDFATLSQDARGPLPLVVLMTFGVVIGIYELRRRADAVASTTP